MTVKFTRPSINIREKLNELDKPSGAAGEALLRAETPQEQFTLIGAGRRNLIINGGFDVWQRGTSGSLVAGPDYISADRWKCYVNSSTTMYLNRQNFTHGQTEVPGNPTYYARFDWLGTSSSQFFSFEQLIEGCHHGSGDHLTVSFWARSEDADNMTLGVNQKFGTGGSSDQTVGNFDIELENKWKRFVITMRVPTITGKTITRADDSLAITWFRSGTNNSYLEIANVQVEVGRVATPFEVRLPGEELALCQRYYQIICAQNTTLDRIAQWQGQIFSSYNATRAIGSYRFPVIMRAMPTLVNKSILMNLYQNGVNRGPTTNVANNYPSRASMGLDFTPTTNLTVGSTLHLDVASGSLHAKAEL
mgnify:CR=1 FL=1|jgi:hypothetical protein